MKRFISLLGIVALLSLLVTGCGRKATPTPRPQPTQVSPSPTPIDRGSIFPLASEEDIKEAISRFADTFAAADEEPMLTALPDGLVVTDERAVA